MIIVKTGPAFGELRTLEEQLEASAFLLKPGVTEAQLDEVHGALEALLLGAEPTRIER